MIMITGIGDHLRPEWPITITGMRKHAPKARDFTNRRYRHHGVVDEIERAKNRIKSIRARVEHSIGVIKRVFGFAKVRYRGLNKNAHRLLVTCALRRAQA